MISDQIKDSNRKLNSFVHLQIAIELLLETSKSVPFSQRKKKRVSLTVMPFYLGQLDGVL